NLDLHSFPTRRSSDLKTTYNSTMIVLGRGLKQELRLFLKEKKIGEILQKRSFNEITLNTFVGAFMPIHTVVSKEVFKENIETLRSEEHTSELQSRENL